ncbi:MAG: hypothetical protein JO057_02965, partial [Chloroflexi bacterium]|nr:hypothetical protein [Chloroflexota bacterium]
MMPELLRFAALSWNGLPIVSLAFLAFGGLMYVWMSRSTSATSTALAIRSPGWLARRRARGGIGHQRDQVGIGYRSGFSPTRLDLASLNHHGYVGGA